MRFALVAILLFLTSPLDAQGQQADKVYRIGYLSFAPLRPRAQERLDAFRKALRDLGYLEGRNIVLEIHTADGRRDQLPHLAGDLVRRKMDLIITDTGTAALAAKSATQTVPIVMLTSGDAVRQGLAASLARPGGNVTGFTLSSAEISRKRLALLRELLPQVSYVGVLWCGNLTPFTDQEWAETRAAADALGVRLASVEASSSGDLPNAFAIAARQRVEAVLSLDCPLLSSGTTLIAQLSLKHRLPGMFPFPEYPRAGSLMSYGANDEDTPLRAATYVDKILKGAKPGELPIEQPTKFQLVINRTTAKAPGLTIPQSLLLRADQVIE